MTQASKQPQFSEEKQCKHCGNKAPMKRAAQYARTVTHFEEETGQTWDESDCYELLECPACGKVELRSYGWSNLMEPSDVVYQTLYPVSSRIPLGLPKPIQKEYEAALQVKSISPNAYGVLMGRVLEMVC